MPNHQVIRLPAVLARTGLSRTAIYQQVAEGTFPKSIKLSARSCGWLAAQVDAWVEQRAVASGALSQESTSAPALPVYGARR